MNCDFVYDPPDQNARCICMRCQKPDVDVAPKEQRFRMCKITPPDCVHFGKETGEVVVCSTCGNGEGWKPKLFFCAIHGDCTKESQVEGHACCHPRGGEPCLDFVPNTLE